MGKKENKKKQSSFTLMFKRLFGVKKPELGLLEEEKLQSPFRTIVRNFVSNRLAFGALIVFLFIFVFVLLGPIISPIEMAYQESTQQNIAPGLDLMKLPSGLKGNVADISAGASFSLGADNNGKLYVWGKSKVTNSADIRDIPEGVQNIVKVAGGYDHAMALSEDGTVYVWGNNRMKQATLPEDIYEHGKIIDIVAGYQLSIAVTEDGYVHLWGNDNSNDVRIKKRSQQGKIQKVAVTADTMIGLTFDGEVLHLGKDQSSISKIPEEIQGKVVDISTTAASCAAVLEDGSVVVWGTITQAEDQVPAMEGAVKQIVGGRYHYTALTEKGNVYAWGRNNVKQTSVAKKAQEGVENIYGGYYQNYAEKTNGSIVTWGLKGYFMGSDELGRDVMGRLINGGAMTMTVGAVAVIISTILGVTIGGISGFFGGKVDLVLQRITEVFAAMPFLPFAMILSTIIGNRLSTNARVYLIMIVLGVLSWTPLSRLVRAQVLAEREKEFVTAARAMGVKKFAIVFKHIIPNVISVIIVSATLDFATCMLTEATLSYLGFGVQLPRPTWGNMLYGCNDSVVIQSYWWRWVFAAALLSICVICINMVGDGLRDAIDPKSNER